MKAIAGIGEIASRYDAFILDIYGVLHNGIDRFPGTIDCLMQLKDAGIKTCLVSNAPERANIVSEHLTAIGISRCLYTAIVTAGESAWHGLERHRGKKLFHFGRESIAYRADALKRAFDIDRVVVIDDADVFTNEYFAADTRIPTHVTDVLKNASKNKIPMICTNPDLIVEVGSDVYICPGTPAKAYEEMGGSVEYHGKPHAPIYAEAQTLLGGIEKARICAVGDGLHTDIQGANLFGIDCVLNLEGIHRRELSLDAGGSLADNHSLKALIDGQPHGPTYVMNGFRW